jgi:hypothetical protein
MNAFRESRWLKSVSLPDSIISIEWFAFTGCDKLGKIYYAGTEEQWNNIDSFSSDVKDKDIICALEDSKNDTDGDEEQIPDGNAGGGDINCDENISCDSIDADADTEDEKEIGCLASLTCGTGITLLSAFAAAVIASRKKYD